MTNDPLAPRQARSRESMRKLLKAATEVLGQHGLEGATIPRIAEHAGLTPGAVYRRFPDKEALLEMVVIGILERQDERLRTTLTPEMARGIPLPILAEQVISSMLVSYRANGPLLRAIRQFVQSRERKPFHKKAAAMEMRALRYMVDLFLERRHEIKHPDPETAVAFGLATVFSTLVEFMVSDYDMKNWRALIPTDDAALKAELLRLFLGYLDVDQP